MSTELFDTLPILLALAGLLLGVAAISARASHKLGVPTALVFIGLGMTLGRQPQLREAIGGFEVAYVVGALALSLILFYGGLATDVRRVRGVWVPSILLATVGVVGVAMSTAAVAYLLIPGLTWPAALILGAVLGSTDAASVLQILAGERIAGRVRETVELESGLNDPMAFILVTAFTTMFVANEFRWMDITHIVWELGAGAGVGAAAGWLAIKGLRLVPENHPEFYPVRTIALALIAYGLAEMMHANGLLAVFISALVLGNCRLLPYRATVVRFHGTLAYFSQIVMFTALGFLVDPRELVHSEVLFGGTLLAVVLAVLARPAVVTAILVPCGFRAREIAGIAWLGLRGAVPVILMTIPLIKVTEPADKAALQPLFMVVFCCVIVGSIIPGSTVRWVMRLLRLRLPPAPQPSASIDIVTAVPLDTTLLMVMVHPDAPIAGRTLAESKLPGEVTVALLVRNGHTERVRGDTSFEVGDEVALSLPERLSPVVRTMFGLEGGE